MPSHIVNRAFKVSSAVCAILAVVLSCAAIGEAQTDATKTKRKIPRRAIILTTDIGAEMDDQWTLAHLALAPEIELRGIVTTHAPSLGAPAAESAAKVAREVLRRMLPAVAAAPPVFAGSSFALKNRTVPQPNAGIEFMIRQSRGFTSKRRLAVLVTGAATDVASALLVDPSLAERVEIIAMGFDAYPAGGDSWNVKNDTAAWRVLLASNAPIVIGDAAVTKRDLAMTRAGAHDLFSRKGERGIYLVTELAKWLDRDPAFCLEVTGAPDTWIIWDEVVTAHLLGMTRAVKYARPSSLDNLRFTFAPRSKPKATFKWIVGIEQDELWRHFQKSLSR